MTDKDDMLHIIEAMETSVLSFFHTVYEWKFGKIRDCTNDYILYEKLGILPDYVTDFLKEVKHVG